jgi:hypothetical protein
MTVVRSWYRRILCRFVLQSSEGFFVKGAYVDGGPCTARGDWKWSKSRLLQWIGISRQCRIDLFAFRLSTTRPLLHEVMETLTAPSRSDLSITIPGAGKHFEMHPSGPSVNSATHMPPPSANQDGENSPHTRRKDQTSSWEANLNSSSTQAPREPYPSTVPVIPQEHDQNDASQSSSQARTPEDASYSQPDSMNSPTRHKRTASGLLKAVDTPHDQRPRAESVSSAGSKAGEVSPYPSCLWPSFR